MADKPETLYLVICGEYSGQWPAALFRDRDMATAYARANDGDVTEMQVSTELSDKEQGYLTPGFHLFSVGMDADGNDAHANEIYKERQMWISFRINDGKASRFACVCVAKDETQAIKILNERRAVWRAFGEPEGKPSRVGYGWMNWAPAEVTVT